MNKMAKVKRGDRVIVTERLRYFVREGDWAPAMLDCIGQTFTVERGSNRHSFVHFPGYTSVVKFTDCIYFFPVECLRRAEE